MATTMKLIAKQTLGSNASTVTFSDIPGTYTDLLLVLSARTTDTAQNWGNVDILPNGSALNGTSRFLYGTGAAAASATATTVAFWAASNACTANTFGSGEVLIPNYAGSTNKSFSVSCLSESNATSALAVASAGLWSQTAAITSLGVTAVSPFNLVSGSSFYLYGITKA